MQLSYAFQSKLQIIEPFCPPAFHSGSLIAQLMMPLNLLLPIALSILLTIVSSAPAFDSKPFSHLLTQRQSTNATSPSENPQVDLGYERYQGFSNATAGLNYFLG